MSQLLQSQGQLETLIEFAKEKKNIDTIVKHHINKEEYKEALEKIKECKEPEVVKQIVNSNCHIFMKKSPGERDTVPKKNKRNRGYAEFSEAEAGKEYAI